MMCPDCEGLGVVVGDLSGSRLKCLRCGGAGMVIGLERRAERQASTDVLTRHADPDDAALGGYVSRPHVDLKS